MKNIHLKPKPYTPIHDLEVFTYVVENGSFSRAAKQLQMDPSSISKLMLRLETRLGVRLLHRHARNLTLTEEGKIFYPKASRILSELKEIEEAVSVNQPPQGRVRLTCSLPFVLHQLIPLLPEFTRTYPHIELVLLGSDTVVDLLAERCDLAIRIGKLTDSSLKVRKLAESKMMLVAAPSYVKDYGIPKTPSDLKNHICLNFHGHPELNQWPFKYKQLASSWNVNSPLSADNGESIGQMVLSGCGIARLSAFMVREALNQKKLLSLLDKYNPEYWQPIYIVHPGYTPKRVKCVIDFIFAKLGGKRFT